MRITVKTICIFACLLIGFSVFLPYFFVSGFGVTVSKSLMDGGDGIYVLIIAAAALVFSAIGKYLPAFFLGAVSLGLFFLENNTVTTNLGKEVDAVVRSLIQNGLGYYCLLGGSVTLILLSVIGLAANRKR